jgi:hypothetical protein
MAEVRTDKLGLVKSSDNAQVGSFAQDFADNMQKIDDAFGTTIGKFVAGTGGVPAFHIVYVNTEGKIQSASCYNLSHMNRIVGMTVEDIAEGQSGLVYRIGAIENPNWNLSPGSVYFLGDGGEIIDTKPDTGFVLVVGVAESATRLPLSIGIPVKLA